jgi:hypothetical protein
MATSIIAKRENVRKLARALVYAEQKFMAKRNELIKTKHTEKLISLDINYNKYYAQLRQAEIALVEYIGKEYYDV